MNMWFTFNHFYGHHTNKKTYAKKLLLYLILIQDELYNEDRDKTILDS